LKRKTLKKGRVFYFHADPEDLKKQKEMEIKHQENLLKKTIPLLQEFKNPFSSPPKINFSQGLSGWRQLYSTILESSTEIYEFAAHQDLMKMGENFIDDFIKERNKKKIKIHAIAKDSTLHRKFQKKDSKQNRELLLFHEENQDLFSSIAIFENKTLILNLHNDAFAILIENKELAESLKTIHTLCQKSLNFQHF
jgi:hypothetical protein